MKNRFLKINFALTIYNFVSNHIINFTNLHKTSTPPEKKKENEQQLCLHSPNISCLVSQLAMTTFFRAIIYSYSLQRSAVPHKCQYFLTYYVVYTSSPSV